MRNMSQPPREQAPKATKDSARKPRRPLAEGPAFRQAMAELESGESSGGWKVLEGPPQRAAVATATAESKPALKAAAGKTQLLTPEPSPKKIETPLVDVSPENPKPPAVPPPPRRAGNRTQLGLAPPAPAPKVAPSPVVAPPPP